MVLFSTALAAPMAGVFLGVHGAGPEHELYESTRFPHEPLGPAATVGARLGAHVWDWVLVEGEVGTGPTLRSRGLLTKARAHGGVLSPAWQGLRAGFLVGGGSLGLQSDALGTDVDYATHLGPLVTYDVSESLALRGDLRWLGSGRRGEGGIGGHTSATVGLSLRPRKRVPDTDGDGWSDAEDVCPNDAELRNGYRDEDGCPDDLADVRVKVLDAEGDLVRNAVVQLNGEPVGNANRDGRLVLPGLMPETTVQLSAAHEGLVGIPQDVVLQPGDNKVDLQLGWAPGTLVVAAKNLGGTPIQAQVWASGPEERRWTLDGNGRSEDVLPVGSWRIMLASEGYDAIIKVVELPDQVGPRGRIDAILRPQRIQLRDDEIVTLDPILFEKGSTAVTAESLGLIEAIAAVLVNNPEISLVEVSGHASAEGTQRSNLQLSQDRVDQVKKMLVARGVKPSRLVAQGYGESQPRADNTTPEGRRANRRVEFKVLRTDAP
jgi:outer membrane protein OmpA-like peptidoglycan-associated protein